MKNCVPEILVVVLVILAGLSLIHQQLATSDVWFHFGQLKSRETIVACFIVGAIALVAGKYLGRVRLEYK